MKLSRLFPDGGYVLMRGGRSPEDHALIFDVGPLGCPVGGGHGHADCFGLQCSVYGEPMIVNPGPYGTTSEPVWRDHFRGSAAHSTGTVDGHGQASPDGPFRWRVRPRARLHRWISTEAYDFADAEHDGYRRLPDPVAHRRRVLFVKPRYWIVLDDLEGAAEHRIDLRFQFAPMRVTVDQNLWVRAQGPWEQGLLIRPFAPVALDVGVRDGELSPIRGGVSPDDGRREPAPVLSVATVARLPLRIVTLLLPVKDPSAPPPGVFLAMGNGRDPMALIMGDGKEIILLDERKLVLEGKEVPCAGSWAL